MWVGCGVRHALQTLLAELFCFGVIAQAPVEVSQPVQVGSCTPPVARLPADGQPFALEAFGLLKVTQHLGHPSGERCLGISAKRSHGFRPPLRGIRGIRPLWRIEPIG